MKILLVYPEFPDTYWSFKYALKFEGRTAAFPPLGLMTVSAMLPRDWERRLVDMAQTHGADVLLRVAKTHFKTASEVAPERFHRAPTLDL